jgi:ferrous iron transport protein B
VSEAASTNRRPRVALVGSPNSGKTTLFNALTGLNRRVANYPGVTVEHAVGRAVVQGGREIELIDLPGTYALEPLSADESVTSRMLSGELTGAKVPDAVIAVADTTTIRRSLPLILEVLARGLPTVVVLTMADELKARGGAIKLKGLAERLGVPVVAIVGNRGIGIDTVREHLANVSEWSASTLDVPRGSEERDILARYGQADQILDGILREPSEAVTLSDRVDEVVLHPVWGIGIFALTMFLFFQAIFVLAAPLQEAFEAGVLAVGEALRGSIPWPLVESLVVDGVIAGVGGVVVFVPQIALLLLLLRFLESSGYLARAAFLIDRVMGWAGLEGRSFVALLSGYACAVPGIMAARTVPDPSSRLATILVTPLMTCSARLPVYTLLIAAFVPERTVAGMSVQGLVMLGLYLMGSLTAFLAAALLRRLLGRKLSFPFYMELPPYRLPTPKAVLSATWVGVRAFLKKAGTIILAASVAIWALLTFPMVEVPEQVTAAAETTAEADAEAAAYALERSAGGVIGHAIEPAIRPLGFDWRIGVGILGSFAAREVIVSTLAQIFAYDGGDEDVAGLGERIRAAKGADGQPAYTLATALSLLVFFVFSLQCVSTLAVMRRETGGWKWPTVAFGYMFVLAWVGSFITFNLARALGA